MAGRRPTAGGGFAALAMFAMVLSPAALAADAAGPAAPAWPQCLAGRYDGSQTEMAAMLALEADGRFGYQLSYGALDEVAEGRWEADGTDVALTSDPVRAPKYSLVSDEPANAPELRVSLDLPRGISAQYFEVLVGFADGARMIRQLSDEGVVIPLELGRAVQSIAIMLPVFSVQSDPFLLSGGGGHVVKVRFEPNELGKVAFAGTRLRREGAELLLERHDRLLRFRPEGRGCLGR